MVYLYLTAYMHCARFTISLQTPNGLNHNTADMVELVAYIFGEGESNRLRCRINPNSFLCAPSYAHQEEQTILWRERMKGIEKARMGIIAVLAMMLVSLKRRLPEARRLSSGITTLALAGIVLLVATGSVSALDPCSAPGNTVVTSSCELTQSYTVPAGQHGYIIGADNIVIDGAGYNISGSIAGGVCFTGGEGDQLAGIYNYNASRMYGYSNVTIKNLEVKNFCTGISVRGALATKKVEDNTIFRCNIHDNGDPTADMNTFGIHFFKHVYNSTIDECEIHHNTGGASSAMACDSGGMGIRLKVGCSHNDIIQNYIHDNVHSGIFTKGGCKFNYVGDNDITGNGLSATGAPCGGITMRCKKTDNWTVEMNNVIDNFGPGMYVGGSYNTIRYNTVMGCKDVTGGDLPSGYAIEVGRSDGGGISNELYNNTFCNNNAGVVDISVCGSGSCTGNIGDDNAADSCAGCGAPNNILYPYTCDNKVSAYFDFDGDGYYSDDPANCACGIIGGAKCACCNPGMFNSSHAGVLKAAGICVLSGDTHDDPNDCNSSILGTSVDWYCDGDGDTYISSAVSGSGAPGAMPAGCRLSPPGDDCDDGNSAVNPGATENCTNGIDDDCNGDIDCDDLYCKPDLDITVKKEEWINDTHYNVNYTVCNIGICDAVASSTSIYIDETRIVVADSVGLLTQNDCYTSTVGPFLWDAPSDNVTVCADGGGLVDEKDETNNCEINTLSARVADIFIDQPDNVDPQSQFTIKIMVDPHDISISAVQYDLYYNTSVVWAEWANPGPFLNETCNTDVTVLSIDNLWDVAGHTGKITYAETTLGSGSGGDLPSVNAEGILTTIHFSAIGERGRYTQMDLNDSKMSGPLKNDVSVRITDCGVTIYNNLDPVANGTSMYRFSNVASKFQCFAVLCPCLSNGGPDLAGWGENITYVRWDFGDGQYGTSEGVDPCEVKKHEYTTWNWNEVTEEYDPFIAYLTVRDDGEPQLSNTTEVPVMVYIAGDTNGDGVVDIFDAACVGKHWGQHAAGPVDTCDPYWAIPQADEADLNNDNDVDTIDAMIVGTNWNHLAYPPYYQD